MLLTSKSSPARSVKTACRVGAPEGSSELHLTASEGEMQCDHCGRLQGEARLSPPDGLNIPKGRALDAGHPCVSHIGVGECTGSLLSPAGGERGSGRTQGVGSCPESARWAEVAGRRRGRGPGKRDGPELRLRGCVENSGCSVLLGGWELDRAGWPEVGMGGRADASQRGSCKQC